MQGACVPSADGILGHSWVPCAVCLMDRGHAKAHACLDRRAGGVALPVSARDGRALDHLCFRHARWCWLLCVTGDGRRNHRTLTSRQAQHKNVVEQWSGCVEWTGTNVGCGVGRAQGASLQPGSGALAATGRCLASGLEYVLWQFASSVWQCYVVLLTAPCSNNSRLAAFATALSFSAFIQQWRCAPARQWSS